ncbi:hypothetical protein [Cellulomonas fimi]|uniref:Uncharacterized protein n=1 Tax=Cellulomonas fimi TaxID=1708 RepID=A0A7Y0M0P5_CELFI|nr:hypothetical protein [Cellulomonas fimi]NMR21610.1 hypothetical protein [Cellulomonas fimi]
MTALLAPEAVRWLTTPVRPGTRVVVAGVAGGVGTTTVVALLWTALDAARPGGVGAVDHSGGSLPARLAAGTHGGYDALGGTEPDLVLHDLGPHALTTAAGVLDVPDQVVVVVCGAHDAGLLAARASLGGLAERTGKGDAEQWAVVVPVAVAGRSAPRARLRDRAVELGVRAAVMPVARDRRLAAGGSVPPWGSASEVHRTAGALAAEVVRCARWVGVTQ